MIKEFLNYHLFSTPTFDITVKGVLLALLVVFFNVYLFSYLAKLIIKTVTRRGVVDGRHHSIIKLIKYLMWVITAVVCMRILKIDLTFLIASSAALLVGFGLGMQIIFKDYMSGIILLLEGTMRVDDIVEVNGEIVKVIEISLRTSEVYTRDGKVVIIPNHKLVEENVINWTHEVKPTRFTIDVGVDYGSDIPLVEQSLLKAAMEHNDIIQEGKHKPFVRFSDFGQSALQFQLIFWSDNLFRIETTKSEIRFRIAALFKENQITIPFNQVVVH